jgi:hypothetical protein
MTPKEQSRANARAALEETAKHFGISVEQAAQMITEELNLRAARKAGVPEWKIDAARAVPTSLMRDIALRDNRAPTGPSSQGVIPSSQQVSNVRTGGSSTGYVVPLSNPPGVAQADRLMDEQDRRDRIELARKLGQR